MPLGQCIAYVSPEGRLGLTYPLRLALAESPQGVGQRNLAVTANTYTHVLADERELDYPNMLA